MCFFHSKRRLVQYEAAAATTKQKIDGFWIVLQSSKHQIEQRKTREKARAPKLNAVFCFCFHCCCGCRWFFGLLLCFFVETSFCDERCFIKAKHWIEWIVEKNFSSMIYKLALSTYTHMLKQNILIYTHTHTY